MGVIALVVVALCVATLMYFSGAQIEVTPSMSSTPINASFTAGPTGAMPFTIISAKKTATASIPSTGTKQVSTSASGSITIYNMQAKPQTLIANTRFATAAGLIYRIHSGVKVPAGTSEKPGTIVATVYADAPGGMYNIGPSSFTVPGLAGTPEADVVYARSTDAIAGGASGPMPIVDTTAEGTAVGTLEGSLASDLKAALEVPAGYVLLPGAATTTYHELAPVVSESAGKADIVVEATVTGVVFPSAALASALVASVAEGAGASLGEAELDASSALTLTPTAGFPGSNGDTFTFSLSGTASLVSKIDPATIATAVAGKTREEAKIALNNYPEVSHATLVLRPFWKSRFPEDPSAITVTSVAPTAP